MRIPTHLHMEATQEESTNFPIVFKLFSLYSGKLGLMRICYTGQDYSGRWEVFFAHTMIAERGSFFMVDILLSSL